MADVRFGKRTARNRNAAKRVNALSGERVNDLNAAQLKLVVELLAFKLELIDDDRRIRDDVVSWLRDDDG